MVSALDLTRINESVETRGSRSLSSHFLAGMIERDSAGTSQKEANPNGYDRRSGADTRQDQDRGCETTRR